MNMTPITPKVKLHAHQDQDGSHINSLIMKHNGNNYNLYAGTEDIIYVFSQPIALYVLTINREYGTIGLNVYMPPEPFSLNCFYMHSTKHIVSILGPMWEQLPAIEITMKLINYLM